MLRENRAGAVVTGEVASTLVVVSYTTQTFPTPTESLNSLQLEFLQFTSPSLKFQSSLGWLMNLRNHNPYSCSAIKMDTRHEQPKEGEA